MPRSQKQVVADMNRLMSIKSVQYLEETLWWGSIATSCVLTYRVATEVWSIRNKLLDVFRMQRRGNITQPYCF